MRMDAAGIAILAALALALATPVAAAPATPPRLVCAERLEGVVTATRPEVTTIVVRLSHPPDATALVWVQSRTEIWLAGDTAPARQGTFVQIEPADRLEARGFCLDDRRLLATTILLKGKLKTVRGPSAPSGAAALPAAAPSAAAAPPMAAAPPAAAPTATEVQVDGFVTAADGSVVTVAALNGSTVRVALQTDAAVTGARDRIAELAAGDMVRIRGRIGSTGMIVASRVEVPLAANGRMAAARDLRLDGMVTAVSNSGLTLRARNGKLVRVGLKADSRVTGLRAARSQIKARDVIAVEGDLRAGKLHGRRARVVATAEGNVLGTVTAQRPGPGGSRILIIDGLVMLVVPADARLTTRDGKAMASSELAVGQAISAAGTLTQGSGIDGSAAGSTVEAAVTVVAAVVGVLDP